jgi:hypothetical protein
MVAGHVDEGAEGPSKLLKKACLRTPLLSHNGRVGRSDAFH